MPLLRSRKCVPCGRAYDVLAFSASKTQPTEVEHGLDDQPDDAAICPGCGSAEFTSTIGAPLVKRGQEYPYFNNGLGVTLESADHERQVVAEMGLRKLEDGEAAHALKEKQRREAEERDRHAAVQARQKQAIEQCPETRRHIDRMEEDKQRALAKRQAEAERKQNQRRSRR